MHIIAIVNAKGGSAKSTAAINLAVAGSRAGRRVLIVDLDEQCTASGFMLGLEESGDQVQLRAAPDPELPDVMSVALGDYTLADAVFETRFPGLDLLQGSAKIENTKAYLADDPGLPARLLEAIRSSEYDLVIIDTPGRFGIEIRLAIMLCDEVYFPILRDLETLTSLGETQAIAAKYSRPVRVWPHAFGTGKADREYLEDDILQNVECDGFLEEVPFYKDMDVRIKANRSPLDPKSKVALAYEKIAAEFH